MPAFQGFSPETLDFLEAIGANNSKRWLEQHRTMYETYLLNPFRELVMELTPVVSVIDSSIEVRPQDVISGYQVLAPLYRFIFEALR